MSTTFGVKIPLTNEVKPIARRINTDIKIVDAILFLLDNEVEVIAMDNSNQGINTVKDLKEAFFNSTCITL